MTQVFQGRAVRGAGVTAAVALLAAVLLSVSGPLTGSGGMDVSHLTAQFGVSTVAATKVVGALNSWWAAALSIALVPVGLGGATAVIRATWTSLVKTLGKEAAKKVMVRF